MPKKRNTRRRRRGSLGPFLRALSVVLAAVAIVVALTLFFKVNQVVISGNNRYTQAEILSVSGIKQGDNLVLLDKYGISQQLYTQLPYISDVRINRKFPDTLLVEVTETKAVAAIRGGSVWWLINAGGKLLEPATENVAKDYINLNGPQTTETGAGRWLTLNEEECPISAQRLLELLEALQERDMISRTDSIDTGDPDKLIIGYDGRFQVEMYYDADFDFKLNWLLAAVEKLEPNEKGIIRMTMADDNEIRFIPTR